MEIFIATSMKSFDLNPTHPGPLPRVSVHTSATQQIERSESKAARGRARSATDEVGDELQKIGEQRTRQILQAASNTLQGQRVAASFCAQETTSAEKRFMKQPHGLAMISSSRLAATPRQLGSSAPRKAKSVSTAKVLSERIKRNDDERLPRLLDCRKWKTTARPRKTLRQPETTTGPRKTRARRRKRARDHPRTRGR